MKVSGVLWNDAKVFVDRMSFRRDWGNWCTAPSYSRYGDAVPLQRVVTVANLLGFAHMRAGYLYP